MTRQHQGPLPFHAVDTAAFRGSEWARDHTLIQVASHVLRGGTVEVSAHEVDAWSILTTRFGAAVDDWLNDVVYPQLQARMGAPSGSPMSKADVIRAIVILGVMSHPDLRALAPPELELERYLHEADAPAVSVLTALPDYGE